MIGLRNSKSSWSRRKISILICQTLMPQTSSSPSIRHYFSTKYIILYLTNIRFLYFFLFRIAGNWNRFYRHIFWLWNILFPDVSLHPLLLFLSGSKCQTKNSVWPICANGSNFLVMLDIAHVFISEFRSYGDMFSNVPISYYRCSTFKYYGVVGVVLYYGPLHNLLLKFEISHR